MFICLAACGCSHASAPPPDEVAAPAVWIESEPFGSVTPDERVDSSAWSGVWTEYFPGRPICQDRFVVRTMGTQIEVESTDCTNDEPYMISEISWDGETLRFVAEPPGGGIQLRYSVRMQGPGQIVGTANETEITWSRTEY